MEESLLQKQEEQPEAVAKAEVIKSHQFRKCFECKSEVAGRICKQCTDWLCTNCYKKIHDKGSRKMH